MARNDGANHTFVRNRDLKADKKATPQSAYAHNERKKESYSNPDIVPERTPMNVHFKSPVGTYEECFSALEDQKVISTWGLKPGSTKMCELIFDVNSAYFFNHGGYEFAKQFYADAYQAAIEIVGGEQYILSAVMHADERNRAMSDALGHDVFHYHMHVVYVPVVEKKKLWSKRCKDPALVGTVKEIIPQVSRSKKWESKPALDENGEPLLDKNGKPVLHHSYSVLQDAFYNHMAAAGYTDVERGERGSSEEHLTVTQFKVDREERRLEMIHKKVREESSEFSQVRKEKYAVEKEIEQKQKRLDQLTPQVEDAERFVAEYLGRPEDLIPKTTTMEYAGHYREKKAKPNIVKLWNVALSLWHTVQELRAKAKDWQKKFETAARDRDILKQRWERALAENADMRSALREYALVKDELGPVVMDNVLQTVKEREAAATATSRQDHRNRHYRAEPGGR